MSTATEPKPAADGRALAKDTRAFADFLKGRMGAIRQVAATHIDPERLYRLAILNVTRTPALRECTIESIFRSVLQAAELGLEPGSAIGEGYLVPFKNQCQFIPGYRGLISLAFRSGHVASVSAKCVYQGDLFEYEEGLTPRVRHVPNFDAAREPKSITYAYCIVHLKDGGVLHDVMTRGEIDAIRGRSKAANSGPWVTDYAEMARKTVTRRCLKYAPMSVEMSKALAADHEADTGEPLDAEFESLELDEEPAAAPSKTSQVKERLGDIPEGENQPGLV